MLTTCQGCSRSMDVPEDARFCAVCGRPIGSTSIEVNETSYSRRNELGKLARRQFGWRIDTADRGHYIRVCRGSASLFNSETIAEITATRLTTEGGGPVRPGVVFGDGQWEPLVIRVLNRRYLRRAVRLAEIYQKLTRCRSTVVKLF